MRLPLDHLDRQAYRRRLLNRYVKELTCRRGRSEGLALVMKLDEFPLVLTVPEAGEVLRVSRNTAYGQAKLFRESGGRDGLPVFVIAGTLRVYRPALERLLKGEPASNISPAPPSLAQPASPPKRVTRRRTDASQLSLVEPDSTAPTARDAS